MEKLVVLSVGDRTHLGFGKGYLYYAGMPSEKVYSFAQRKWEFPYMGFGWNLYFPLGSRKISVEGVNIVVENVTADEVRLRI